MPARTHIANWLGCITKDTRAFTLKAMRDASFRKLGCQYAAPGTQVLCSDVRKAVDTIRPHSRSRIQRKRAVWIGSIFGKYWLGHGVYARGSLAFGDRLTEPRITRRLAYFLGEYSRQTQNFPLLETFLSALSSFGSPEGWTFEKDIATVRVSAEESLIESGETGRTDLLIEWTEQVNKRFVIIEAKIDAGEGDTQLEKYRDYAKKRCKDAKKEKKASGDYWLVFLTPNGRPPTSDDPIHWTSVSWIALLKRWEQKLQAAAKAKSLPPDIDFHRFRYDLWQMCT